MKRPNVQYGDERKIFLMQNLTNLESKLKKYQSDITRMKWKCHDLGQKQLQLVDEALNKTLPNEIRIINDAEKNFTSILNKYKNTHEENAYLQKKLEKNEAFRSFQVQQVENLKKERSMHNRNVHFYYEKIKALYKILANRDMTIKSLKYDNLLFQKRIQDFNQKFVQSAPLENYFTEERDEKKDHEILHDLFRIMVSNLKKLIISNQSMIQNSLKQVKVNVENIAQDIQRTEKLRKELQHIQVYERSDHMWNIWKKDEEEKLMNKVDSLSQQIQSIENDLINYKDVLEEYNENLKQYEENYNSLKESLEHLEESLENSKETEDSYTQELKQQLQTIKESEQSYKEQINMLNAKIEQQNETEQKYKRKLSELKGKDHRAHNRGSQNKSDSTMGLEEKEMNKYQQYPLAKGSKSTEFDPFKYNQIMTKRSE